MHLDFMHFYSKYSINFNFKYLLNAKLPTV